MEEGSTSSTSFTPIPSLMQASQLPAKPPALTIQVLFIGYRLISHDCVMVTETTVT